jgi:hypothetical protein
MDKTIRQSYIDTYKPLLTEFANEIKGSSYTGIPEPFLPVHGKLYETAKTRIAFVGMETRGWGDTSNFVSDINDKIDEVMFRNFEEFDDLEFRFWGSNFGNSFWDFNFKFLAAYYGVDNWKEVKNGEHENILRSFAWGNTNSIERYHVTAKNNGVDYDSWLCVKNASKQLDGAKHILNILRPDIMVILNWGTNEEWLIKGLSTPVNRQEIDNHLWYYYLPDTKTHVLWTAHPTWLSKNKIFGKHIDDLVVFVKQKMTEHI